MRYEDLPLFKRIPRAIADQVRIRKERKEWEKRKDSPIRPSIHAADVSMKFEQDLNRALETSEWGEHLVGDIVASGLTPEIHILTSQARKNYRGTKEVIEQAPALDDETISTVLAVEALHQNGGILLGPARRLITEAQPGTVGQLIRNLGKIAETGRTFAGDISPDPKDPLYAIAAHKGDPKIFDTWCDLRDMAIRDTFPRLHTAVRGVTGRIVLEETQGL